MSQHWTAWADEASKTKCGHANRKEKEGVAEKTYQIGHMCELVKSKANVHKPTYRQVSKCCKKFKCKLQTNSKSQNLFLLLMLDMLIHSCLTQEWVKREISSIYSVSEREREKLIKR